MSYLTVFVFFVAITLSAVFAKECGLKSNNRIVNGVDAAKNEFPWQVSWRYVNQTTQTDRHVCGGSIISENWIITAAHCVDLNDNVNNINTADFLALLGEHSLGTPDSDEVKLKVKQIIVHPNWDSKAINNDLAVVELERALDFDGSESHLTPICLAESTHEIEGKSATISGWGLTKYQGDTLPDILQKAVVPVVLQSSCKSSLGWLNPITDGMICAGGGSIGVCNGDSGGPLQYDIGGKWHLAGATSWGVGCAFTGFPGVFTRITSYRSFIKENTGV